VAAVPSGLSLTPLSIIIIINNNNDLVLQVTLVKRPVSDQVNGEDMEDSKIHVAQHMSKGSNLLSDGIKEMRSDIAVQPRLYHLRIKVNTRNTTISLVTSKIMQSETVHILFFYRSSFLSASVSSLRVGTSQTEPALETCILPRQ
jgi:hypothetical protein